MENASGKEAMEMTHNQIAYWQNVETARANRAREGENLRSNVAKETENIRSNKAREEDTDIANATQLKNVDQTFILGAQKNDISQQDVINKLDLGNAANKIAADKVEIANREADIKQQQANISSRLADVAQGNLFVNQGNLDVAQKNATSNRISAESSFSNARTNRSGMENTNVHYGNRDRIAEAEAVIHGVDVFGKTLSSLGRMLVPAGQQLNLRR